MAWSAREGGVRRRRDAVSYRRDPLAFWAAEFDGVHDVWRSTAGRVCVAGPAAAREVLGNRRGTFVETSDFFHTRTGVFGPRPAQIQIGHAARDLIRGHLDERRADLPRLVGERLVPASYWPDAGNLLVREHLRDILLRPDAPAELHETLQHVIARAVLAGAREQQPAFSRRAFRRRAMGALVQEIEARRGSRRGGPADLLGVTVAGAGWSADPVDVAEVYLSLLFATVGSVGFALGWSVYLAGRHPRVWEEEPVWIVREALRLWPVAWLFARTPSRAHHLAGVPTGPHDEVNVCLYLVHRHPHHWEHPHEFAPRRWAAAGPDPAFLPFGAGPHACTGAAVTMRLLADLIGIITRDWRLSVTAGGDGPRPGPALAPPPFLAELRDRVAPGRR